MAVDTGTLIERLRQARHGTHVRLADSGAEALGAVSPWRGGQSDLRLRLSWLAERDEARRVRTEQIRTLLDNPPSVAQRVMTIGGETRGRLLGSLIGVTEQEFEREPAPGEWSIRGVLGHVIATDRRYQIAVEYAASRRRSGSGGPLRPPESALPPRTGEAESAGTMADVLERLTTTRDNVVEAMSAVPDDLLEAPTNWLAWDLDVRFRLHRFAAHDREHTIQLRRTLDAFGMRPSETRMLLAGAAAQREALIVALRCTPAELLDVAPAGDGATIVSLIDEALNDEREL